MAETQAAQAVADPITADNSADTSMDNIHAAQSMADPTTADNSANTSMDDIRAAQSMTDPTGADNSADTSMDDIRAAQSMAHPTRVDASTDTSMDDIHAAQYGGDLITGGQTPILHPSPPRTPRLQPAQEPNTEIDVLDLASPLSSARSVSPPPYFMANSEEHSEGEATDQEQPEGAVADPSAEVPKRNTTEEAKTKAEKIKSAGVPHAKGRCKKCTSGDHECVVNPAVSGGNTCSKCAEHKEKCSHQLTKDGYSLRTIGRKVAKPCNNCAKKIQQGIATECFKASASQSEKWGTACSECMIDGTTNTCSFKKKKKARAKKSRAKKVRASKARA